jgi:hypothetical protein
MRYAIALLTFSTTVALGPFALAAERDDRSVDTRIVQVPTSPGDRGPSGPRGGGRPAEGATEESATKWIESFTGWGPPDPTGTRFYKPAISGGTGPTL